jgi:hypothetical protein
MHPDFTTYPDSLFVSVSALTPSRGRTARGTCGRHGYQNMTALHSPLLNLQIAKLLVIPYVCLVERFVLGHNFSRQVLATILLVIAGVGIV